MTCYWVTNWEKCYTALNRKDGSRITIGDSAAAIRDKNSDVVGVVLVFRELLKSGVWRRKSSRQRSSNRWASLPAGSLVMADYLRYGFSGVVTKPYTIAGLGQVIAEVINKR